MSRYKTRTLLAVLVQCILSGAVIGMGIFVHMPWMTIAAVAVLYVETVLLVLQGCVAKRQVVVGLVATSIAWGGLFFGTTWLSEMERLHAVVVLVMASGVMFAGRRCDGGSFKRWWNILGISWLFVAGFLWIAVAYVHNLKIEFYVGLGMIFVLLFMLKRLFKLPGLVVQAVNTLLLLLVGVPVADVLVRPNYRLNTDAIAVQKYYSYEFAKQNPAAFGHWWNHFVNEWRKLQRQICTLNNRGSAPWVLRPGSEGQMFQSVYRINKLGFRGPEIPFEKGDAYRIVALGESTTFGQTMNADDLPWPEVLERLIREELKPDRPVQVINAGVPSYTIRVNVLRLEKHILPLKPDMIISYHGYNGFMYLNPSLPPTHGKGPPPYKERPLKLLADSEYRFKMMAYRHSRVAPVTSTNTVPDDPMKTEYADAYRDLIQATHTNGIKLVLANYSMAVNAQSDADVVTFYRAGFPRVLSEMDANQVHSQIVSKLAAEHSGIHPVDTHPGLDGQHEKFIDLVHFTQAGRKQIAETMFKSIKPILKQEMTTHESPTE